MSAGKNKEMPTFKRHVIVTVLAFGIVGMYALFALNLSMFKAIPAFSNDYTINDFYYTILNATTSEEEIDTSMVVTMVDMTELPDRRALSEALEDIMALEPKAVIVDMIFQGRKEDVVGDSMIAATAANHPNIIFSFEYTDDTWTGEEFTGARHSFFADSLEINEGFCNMPRSIYGHLKRKYSVGENIEGKLQPSLIKAAVDMYAGTEVEPLSTKQVDINYTPKAFVTLFPDEVFEHADEITDRIVIFGALTDQTDMHDTSQGKIPGPKVLAYSVETMLNRNAITNAPEWITWTIGFIIVLLTKILFDYYGLWASRLRRPFPRFILSTVLIVGFVKFAWMALFMWFAFLLFSGFHYSINLAWALSAIPFNATANDLYNKFLIYLEDRKKPKYVS